MFSSLNQDFVVTPTVDTKEIVFSSIHEELLPVLSVGHFVTAEIFRVLTSGVVESLPTTEIEWNDTTKTLTLLDMVDEFQTGDILVVCVNGERSLHVPGADYVKEVLGVAHKKVIGSEFSSVPFSYSATVGVQVATETTQLESFWVHNKGEDIVYLQFHDRTSSPGGSDAPLFWKPIAANTISDVVLPEGGLYLVSGLWVGISSTKSTYTAVSTPANFDLGGFKV